MMDVCWPRSPDGLCSLSFERAFYAQTCVGPVGAFYAHHLQVQAHLQVYHLQVQRRTFQAPAQTVHSVQSSERGQ